jgi:hypothetical protein
LLLRQKKKVAKANRQPLPAVLELNTDLLLSNRHVSNLFTMAASGLCGGVVSSRRATSLTMVPLWQFAYSCCFFYGFDTLSMADSEAITTMGDIIMMVKE